jgi:seryl-tRNA synthetase
MQEGKPQSSRRDQLKAEIDVIRTTIKANLEKLAKLEKERKAAVAKAAEAGQKNVELEGKVTAMERLTEVLKASLEEKSKLIAELEVKVLNLAQTVEEQAGVIQEKEGVIDTQVKEINKAYVAVANKATLREKGLIEKKGDVLGLGGNWLRTGKFDPEVFREIDVRTEVEFPIGAAVKKIRVLSDHPKDSYELTATAEGGSLLKITDTTKFWQGSKYLVVMIPD